MNKLLYSRLAAQNMVKNAKFYLPYLLAIIGTTASYYIVTSLSSDPSMVNIPRGGVYLQSMMWLGTGIITLFVAIFLFYTNSFLIKRRKKELGLYNILGMEKRHIAAILAYESLYTAFIGIGGGLLCGIGLYKLVVLILGKILRFDVVFGFSVSTSGLQITVIVFSLLLLLLLISNLLQIRHVKPVELMRGGNMGEREPKTRWVLTLLGILTLGGGYWIAMTTRNALETFAYYFLAVFLVVIGTYCLFTSVSIAALKLMRKSKRFYYRPNHFISVSGMLYRMKQNAVGLANICILSTMVMVMVSGTVSLYAGTEEQIDNMTPSDIMFTAHYDPTVELLDIDGMKKTIIDTLKANEIPVKSLNSSDYLYFSASRTDGGFSLDRDNSMGSGIVTALQFVTANEYAQLTGTEPVELNSDEVLVYGDAEMFSDAITLFMPKDSGVADVTLKVAGTVSDYPVFSDVAVYMVNKAGIVVRDQTVLTEIYSAQKQVYGRNSSNMRWEVRIDTDADDAIVMENYSCLYDAFNVTEDGALQSIRMSCRAININELYSLNGSFLFLGLFLGLVFIIATVLIIYYKQISEGYDDKARFEIMQKVGLSRREARRTINHQILMVFFLPLIVAAMHIVMDFRMLTQLLSLFSLGNTQLTFMCSLATFGVFSLVYGIVYMLTARVYYRIVQ